MSGGYISEDAKQKFSIRVGIWGVVFFLGQIIIPVIFMFIIMAPLMFFMITSIKEYDLGQTAPYKNGILTIAESGIDAHASLMYAQEHESEKLFDLAEDPRIAYANGDIWCFTEPCLFRYSNDEWTTISNTMHWGNIVDIKAIENGLIVWSKTPEGTNEYMSYFEDRWIMLPQLMSDWKLAEKVVEHDGNTWEIVGDEHKLYSRVNATGDWITIGHSFGAGYHDRWHVEVLNDDLYVFARGPEPGPSMCTWKLTDGQWEEQDIPGFPRFTRTIAVVNRTNELYIISGFGPAGLSWYRFDGEQCQKVSGSSGFPFPTGMMGIMFIPYVFQFCMPVLFAFVVTLYIRQYRVKEYITELGSVCYAPVIHRAFAEIVDVLIVILPGIVLFIVSGGFGAFFDIEQQGVAAVLAPLMMFGAFASMCFLGVVMLFVYSFLEGTYGATPGKWLMGIRVISMDTLRPCGFGRALLRNLLRFVDGFFNYLVGILIVAYTENQQRVGDLAARTIVIRVRKGEWVRR
jgi:uncharacterized RDD family membrane protein YckC